MSQINGSGQGSRQLSMRAKYLTLDGYADTNTSGRTNVRMSANDYNQYESTPAFVGFADLPDTFGAYQRDSQAAEQLRDFYDTVDAVSSRALLEGNNVQRVANISDREIQLMAESKEVERSKKWEQYWWSTADNSKPWTMTELNKIDPAMVQRNFDAIQEVSHFALDKAIIKHLGHSGDPHLAQLQYMMDQGQMDHMPQTVLIDRAPYHRGPLSVFGLGQADDKSRFAQGMLSLALLGTTAFGAAYYAVRAQPRAHKNPRLDGDVHTVTNIRTRPHDWDGAGHEIGAPPTRLLPWDVGTLDPLAGMPAPPEPVGPSAAFLQLVSDPRGRLMAFESPEVAHGFPSVDQWDPAALTDYACTVNRPPDAEPSREVPRTGDSNSLDPGVFTVIPARLRAGTELEQLAVLSDVRDQAELDPAGLKPAPAAHLAWSLLPGDGVEAVPKAVSGAPLQAEVGLARFAAVDAQMHAAVIGARPSAEVGDAARVVAAARRAIPAKQQKHKQQKRLAVKRAPKKLSEARNDA
ncbi:hypothetical protein T492DRAFT_861947 [Pavlovales sp. CCMP2436]|nr:hypothetical protein T492DRAFT_861947 [Pavlovales sp. CCMP2436]